MLHCEREMRKILLEYHRDSLMVYYVLKDILEYNVDWKWSFKNYITKESEFIFFNLVIVPLLFYITNHPLHSKILRLIHYLYTM